MERNAINSNTNIFKDVEINTKTSDKRVEMKCFWEF